MGIRLLFLPNCPGATFIQGGTFIPDSRVEIKTFSLVLEFEIMCCRMNQTLGAKVCTHQRVFGL
jgi:hypothetical protein